MKKPGIIIRLSWIIIWFSAIPLPILRASHVFPVLQDDGIGIRGGGIPQGDSQRDSQRDSQQGDKDLLTIFVYPPSSPVNLDSPQSMLWSVIRIEINRLLFSYKSIHFEDNRGEPGSLKLPYRSTIGHTLSLVSCTLPDNTVYEQWASLSSYHYSDTALHQMLKQQQGLGVLYHKFADGVLISGDENLLRLVHYHGPANPSIHNLLQRESPRYMSFPLDTQQCRNIRDMVEFYKSNHPEGATPTENQVQNEDPRVLYFTNVLDPYESYMVRKRTGSGDVGGGCAPFGMALLKIAGLHVPEYDAIWKQRFHISEKLIGNAEKKVSFFKLLFGSLGKKWSHPGYPDRILEIYDPELIWNYIGFMHQHFSVDTFDAQKKDQNNWINTWLTITGTSIAPGNVVTLSAPKGLSINSGNHSTTFHHKNAFQQKEILGIRINKNLPNLN